MKLVWSPELASKAYIDTVNSCRNHQDDSGVAELVSAMAAGWNSRLIVETWSSGIVIAMSIGLAVAARHTGSTHVCIVPDNRSRSDYLNALGPDVAPPAEVIVGEPNEALASLPGIDFMLVDCQRHDFVKALRSAQLGDRGAVLVCKNSQAAGCRWRTVLGLDSGSRRRLVRSVSLPVGKGLDIAHIASVESSSAKERTRKWITHVDSSSGEEIVIRR